MWVSFIEKWWLDALFGIILSILLFGYRTIVKRFSVVKDENNAIKEGVKALLHDRIIILGKLYERQGYCTPEEFEEFEELYKPYHEGLNGNGSGTRMYNIVRSLPPHLMEDNNEKNKT